MIGTSRKNFARQTRLSQLLLASTAAIPLLSVPAVAQTSAQPSAQPAAGAGGLEEIVVTARKRSEDIQVTPVAITAISAVEAKQATVREFQDLRGLVPDLEITPVAAGGAVNLTIRGIGQPSVQVNVDNKVGFYLNDMYIARSEGNEFSFYDIDSLQVLKGPQGTLFGKNTTAGAVLLTTKRPSDDYNGYVEVEGGNYNRFDTEGGINLPLLPGKLDARVSWRTRQVDGYIKHLLDSQTSNDYNDKSVRLQFKFTPIDALTIDLMGEYNDSNTNGRTYQGITVACNNNATYPKNYNLLHAVPFCNAYPILGNPYEIYGGNFLSIPANSVLGTINNAPGTAGYGLPVSGANAGVLGPYGHAAPFSIVKAGTMIFRATYDINDQVSVKSITGFRRDVFDYFAPDYYPICIYCEVDNSATEEISQELDVNGNFFDGALTVVAGLYYETQDTGFAQVTGPDWIDPIGYNYIASNWFLSEAAFIQASYKITDQLNLTLGARYNYDKKDVNSNLWEQTKFSGPTCGAVAGKYPNSYYAAFVNGAQCGGYYIGVGSHNWYDFDPRVQLDYRITPDIMAYFNFTGGYNAGGFNQQLGTQLSNNAIIPYNRERVWSYEGGIKSEWLDHRLRVNVDGFYQTYDNLQATIVVTYNGVTTRAIQNAAAAHEDGVELEIEALPTPDLIIRANGAYLDQAYDTIGKGVTSITLTTPVSTAPRWEGSVAADYTFHLPSDATLVFDANYKWVGSKASCTPLGACYIPTYGLLGARATYTTGDGVWSLSLWSTNMLNKLWYLSYQAGPNANMGETGFQPGDPQEYGAALKYTFGGPVSSEAAPAAYTPPPAQAPAPPPAPHNYMVFFDFNKSDLTPQAVTIVDTAAKNATTTHVTQITCTGHTDTVGSDAYNMRLSRRRAESVAAELEKQGIPSSEIEIVAKGKQDLLVPTGDGVREPQNRRVQIVYSGGPTS